MRKLLVSCLIVWTIAGGWASRASAETAYALDTSNKLYRFDTGDVPMVIVPTLIGQLTGFAAIGEDISAMDFRPVNGQLYGLGTQGHLYLIDPITAKMELLATLTTHGLPGSSAMDFDPRADKLRVVSYTGANFLIDPDNFTVTTQTPIAGMSGGGLAGLAFTTNIRGAMNSTLFAIDTKADVLYRIGNVADHTGASQASGAKTTIGSLGVNFGANAGFDIVANTNIAYLLTTVNTVPSFYRIDLQTGAANLLTQMPVQGGLHALAVYSQRQRIYAVTTTNKLVTVESFNAGFPASGASSVPVSFTGLQPNEQIVAIDVRPATGVLYGFTDASRLYTIAEPSSAQQTSVQATFVANVAIPNDTLFGMDFDPSTDRLHISNNASQLFIVNPTTGAVILSSPIAGRKFVGLAFTDSIAGASSTRQYAIDATNNELVTLFGQTVTDVGQFSILNVNADAPQGFDISPLDNAAFFSYSILGTTESMLYALDLRTTNVLPLGKIYSSDTATKYQIRDIAVASPGIIQVGAPSISVSENAVKAAVSIQRKNGKNGPMSVMCSTADVSASQASDYVATAERIVWGDSDILSKSCYVPLTDDTLSEPDEVFAATLHSPFGGAGVDSANAAMMVTIVDDDTNGPGKILPTIAINSPTSGQIWSMMGSAITLAGAAQDADGTVSTVEWATNRGFNGTATGTTSWTAANIPLLEGSNTIVVTATDNDGNIATDALTVNITPKSYYLAEGATGVFFDLDIAIANPNTTPAPVRLTFLREGDTPIVINDTLLPTSRKTIHVDDIPGLEWASVSTVVTSTTGLPLFVERTMQWGSGGYGAHTEKATDGPELTWYFAEGSQGFFSTFLLLANPNFFDINAEVEYLLQGNASIERQYTVPAQRRLTVDLGADAALVGNSFGMIVTFTNPGVAERAMYFGTNPVWSGGHESAGVTAPANQWFLAEGATGVFFETFVLVANPNDQPANVVMTYLPENGTPVVKPAFTLGPKQRVTFNIEQEDPALASAAVATQVSADQPILVERAQYWPDPAPNWYESHNSFGANLTATTWGFAEGRVGGGASAYQTFILLANTNDAAAAVTITFLREDGSTLIKHVTVPATSRLTVPIGTGTLVPELQEERFGALVTSDLPIVAEHAMYWNVNGQIWGAGTNALGTVLYEETSPAPRQLPQDDPDRE